MIFEDIKIVRAATVADFQTLLSSKLSKVARIKNIKTYHLQNLMVARVQRLQNFMFNHFQDIKGHRIQMSNLQICICKIA